MWCTSSCSHAKKCRRFYSGCCCTTLQRAQPSGLVHIVMTTHMAQIRGNCRQRQLIKVLKQATFPRLPYPHFSVSKHCEENHRVCWSQQANDIFNTSYFFQSQISFSYSALFFSFCFSSALYIKQILCKGTWRAVSLLVSPSYSIGSITMRYHFFFILLGPWRN